MSGFFLSLKIAHMRRKAVQMFDFVEFKESVDPVIVDRLFELAEEVMEIEELILKMNGREVSRAHTN